MQKVKPQHILVFYQYFGTPKGSWSTRIYELTRRWVMEGAKVTVVTSPYEKSDIQGKGFISKQEIEGINLIVINSADSNRAGLLKRAVNALLFSLVSIWYALSLKYDVVIASSGPITVGLPGLVGKWIKRKKFVFEVRDLWPQGAVELKKLNNPILIRVAFWFEGLCYNNADLVVSCSLGMEDSIVSRFPHVNSLVIPNSSDPELFSHADDSFQLPAFLNECPYFIYTGSLGLMDDCMVIVEAMNLIKMANIHFVFIGEGTERKDLEEKVKEYGISDKVHFLGLLPKTEVVQWLQRAEGACVMFKEHPVLGTSSPNKLFDAFAAGIPVIQNTQGWMKTLIEKEQCGMNIPSKGAKELSVAFSKIISDLSLKRNFGNASKRLGNTSFNRGLLAIEYMNRMEDLF